MKSKYYRVVLNKDESGSIPDFPVYVEEINNKLIDIVSNEEIIYASSNDFLNTKSLSYNEKYLVPISEVISSLKNMSPDDILNYRKTMYYLKKSICSSSSFGDNDYNKKIEFDINDKESCAMYREINRIKRQVFKIIKIK